MPSEARTTSRFLFWGVANEDPKGSQHVPSLKEASLPF